MIEVGDLVKRVASFSPVGEDFGWQMYDFPIGIGIVIAIELPSYEGLENAARFKTVRRTEQAPTRTFVICAQKHCSFSSHKRSTNLVETSV